MEDEEAGGGCGCHGAGGEGKREEEPTGLFLENSQGAFWASLPLSLTLSGHSCEVSTRRALSPPALACPWLCVNHQKAIP